MTRRRRSVAALVAVTACSAGLAGNAQAGEKGFWGPTKIKGVSQFPVYKSLGVTLYQQTLLWNDVAPTRPAHPTDPADPAYAWPEDMDAVIKEAARNHMRVLLMIIGAPSWSNGGHPWQWVPDPKFYAQFAEAASRRYPAVRQWMIWGEPSRTPNFQPLIPQTIGRPLTAAQAKAPQRYAEMLDAAYVSLKRVRRSNVVIGGNTYAAGDIRPVNWANAMRLPNGHRPRLDVYGHNPFTLRTPDLSDPPGPGGTVDFSDLGRFQKVVNRDFGRPGRRHVPIFLSEFTIPTGLDGEFNFYTTKAKQAEFIEKGFGIARKIRAYGLGWIHLRDEPRPNGEGIRGGLLNADGTRKPGFYAFKRAKI